MITPVLLTILLLFITLQVLKKWTKLTVCILCAASSITWIILLVLYRSDLFDNFLVISILVGATVHGLYSEITKRMKVISLIFRIPILFTLIVAGYTLLKWQIVYFDILFVLALWGLFLLIYAIQGRGMLKGIVDSLIKCCRDF